MNPTNQNPSSEDLPSRPVLNSSEVINQVIESGEQLMASIQDLIKWTDYDVSQITDYLKRIGKFLAAVIEAHPITYTVEALTHKLELDEPTLRRLLRDVGVEIDPAVSNPDETVTEDDIIALLADRAGSPVGDRLMDLLRGDGPYVTWW